MGHARSEDLRHFDKCVEGLDLQKVVQTSMDGPNVNLKFHRLLQDQIERKHSTTLLDVGSCGLHVVNGAYRNGVAASGWRLRISFPVSTAFLRTRQPDGKITLHQLAPPLFPSSSAPIGG